MNNKGQAVFVLFMIAVTVLVMAIALAHPVTTFVDYARNESDGLGGTGLNCTNPNLSEYDQGACGITDITPAYFIGGLIVLAGMIAYAKGFI